MKVLGFILFFVAISQGFAHAQISDYQRANELMQQQRYQEALPLFETLYRENRRSLLFFESYVDCLVALRDFDLAIESIQNQIRDGFFELQATLKLAEVLHISGRPEEAYPLWQELAQNNPLNVQLLFSISNSMIGRQEFDLAIQLYKEARENLRDKTLFLNELGNLYMLAGKFEESVNEFFTLIIESPDQVSLVQQRFFRMRDQQLYEIAAFELEDRLLELHYTHPAYSSLAQLLTWLLLETEQFRRAYLFARNYENQTPFTIYSLISLASQLRSAGQFELAAEALQFYLNDGNETIRLRAREDLASVYVDWAEYLKRHNLKSASFYNQLYLKASGLKKELLETAPDYVRADRIFGGLTDLLVDHQKNTELAEEWIEKMRRVPQILNSAWLSYSEGKVALFNGEFTLARQAFTRASRETDNPNLEERLRYLLSLTDFYSADYDFALIQLRSLERRSTSFYANDAIHLGMKIQYGLQADTTRSLLNTSSKGSFLIHTGRYSEALEILAPLFSQPGSLLVQAILTELNRELPVEWLQLQLQLTNYILASQSRSPYRERLLWDRIILMERILSGGTMEVSYGTVPSSYSFLRINAEDPLTGNNPEIDHYLSALEDLLMEFPDGFYADFARERIMATESLSPEI